MIDRLKLENSHLAKGLIKARPNSWRKVYTADTSDEVKLNQTKDEYLDIALLSSHWVGNC